MYNRLTLLSAVFVGLVVACPGAQAQYATEWTQILNNGQLVDLAAKNATQITNQMTQISNQVTQISNQIRIYQNMLQNTAQLPQQVWNNATRDIAQLQNLVQQGQGIAYSMGNIDTQLQQRFPSYSSFQANLPNAQNYSQTYNTWSQTNRDTVAGTLKAAGLTSNQFATEDATMQTLKQHSQSADGQMKALQVGHEIAAQEIEQIQKLRALVSQQAAMTGTWYQSQQAQIDLERAAREKFFSTRTYPMTGGLGMKPNY